MSFAGESRVAVYVFRYMRGFVPRRVGRGCAGRFRLRLGGGGVDLRASWEELDMGFAIRPDGTAPEGMGIEDRDEMAGTVQHNHSPIAVLLFEFRMNDIIRGLVDALMQVRYAVADVQGNRIAHEILARSAGGDSTAEGIAGIGSRFKNRRVAHPAGQLPGGSPRGCSGSQIAVYVERHGTRRSEMSRCGGTLMGFPLFVFLTPASGDEVAVRHELHSLSFSERLGTAGDQHDVRGSFHHQTSERDGMRHVLHRRNRACLKRLAIHDGGVELGYSFGVDHRAAPGVELAAGVVLEGTQSRFDRID